MSWPLVKLGDIFNISSSKRVLQEDWRESGIPFYRAREVGVLSREGKVDNALFIDESMYEEFKLKYGVPQEGDILITAVGTLGLTYAVTSSDKFYFKDASVIRLSKKSDVDTKYVQYAIKSSEVQRFIQNSNGATVGTYTINKAKDTQIPLPPLNIQKKIAAVLEKADQLRKDCQQMEQELNNLAQSVFIDMFGDPVTNPKGWDVKPVSSLLSQPLQNGAYYPKEYYCDDGVEMVHMGDVFYDFIPRGGMKRVNASIKDIEKYRLTSNDLLISRRSLMLEGAAKPSLIEASNEDLIFESSMIRLTPDNEVLNVMYLFYYLSNPTVKQHYIFQYITGATIKGINQSNLEKVEVLVPDFKVQEEFLIIEEKIRKQKSELSKLVEEYEVNFNSLMQKAFKGELNL